jgi:hypothetical protein
MGIIEIDSGLNAFIRYADVQVIRDIRRGIFGELEYELRRRIAPPVAPGALAEPEQAVPYIHACRDIVEQFLSEQFGGYSGARWLYYLRRLPIQAFPVYQGGLNLYPATHRARDSANG